MGTFAERGDSTSIVSRNQLAGREGHRNIWKVQVECSDEQRKKVEPVVVSCCPLVMSWLRWSQIEHG